MSQNDPFAGSGGGVLVNGGWVPKNHPLAQQQPQPAGPTETTRPPGYQAQAPGYQPVPMETVQPPGLTTPQQQPTTPPPPGQPQPTTPDPFAAMGGGAFVNGGWVPKNHPLAQQAGVQTPPTNPQAPWSPSTPTAPGQPSFADQVRTQVLTQMNTNPNEASINDPDLAPAAAASRAAIERNRREGQQAMAERFNAEGMNSSSSGFNDAVATGFDNAGRASAEIESQMVMKKLDDRRQQLMQALGIGASLLSEDQKLAMSRELAMIDAQVRREGYGTQESIAGRENSTRERLGIGGLNLGFIEAMLRNRQADNSLGFQIGQHQSGLDSLMAQMMGGF